ncbi:hypothetical protein [Pseudovibrio sp. Ad37]|uniref:hypothetical protein n=1 Tax=Pseudovibrio sp. Ad37 TaxID=989422 RepID=UPI0007AE585F|nr:hypothetical protein [Pseudovibrio sp. Ad37]KZL24264.1 hypothetical protein PsAD37_02835 [Pseudovibrio sp. Ad37]
MITRDVIIVRIRKAFPHAPLNLPKVAKAWLALLQKDKLTFDDAGELDVITGTDNFVLLKIFERANFNPAKAFALWLQVDSDIIREIYSDHSLDESVYQDLIAWAGRRYDQIDEIVELGN